MCVTKVDYSSLKKTFLFVRLKKFFQNPKEESFFGKFPLRSIVEKILFCKNNNYNCKTTFGVRTCKNDNLNYSSIVANF